MAGQVTSFRQVVGSALSRAIEGTEATAGETRLVWINPADLAREIHDGLKAAGYSIHRSGECVHPRTRKANLGREMTEEEEEALLRDTQPVATE